MIRYSCLKPRARAVGEILFFWSSARAERPSQGVRSQRRGNFGSADWSPRSGSEASWAAGAGTTVLGVRASRFGVVQSELNCGKPGYIEVVRTARVVTSCGGGPSAGGERRRAASSRRGVHPNAVGGGARVARKARSVAVSRETFEATGWQWRRRPNSPLHLSALLGSAPAGPGLALRSPQVNAMVLGLALGDSCSGGSWGFGAARCRGEKGARVEVLGDFLVSCGSVAWKGSSFRTFRPKPTPGFRCFGMPR